MVLCQCLGGILSSYLSGHLFVIINLEILCHCVKCLIFSSLGLTLPANFLHFEALCSVLFWNICFFSQFESWCYKYCDQLHIWSWSILKKGHSSSYSVGPFTFELIAGCQDFVLKIHCSNRNQFMFWLFTFVSIWTATKYAVDSYDLSVCCKYCYGCPHCFRFKWNWIVLLFVKSSLHLACTTWLRVTVISQPRALLAFRIPSLSLFLQCNSVLSIWQWRLANYTIIHLATLCLYPLVMALNMKHTDKVNMIITASVQIT